MKTKIILALALVTLGSAARAQSVTSRSIDAKTAWSTLDAGGQYALIRNDSARSMTNTNYIVDALEDKLTSLGRYAYAARCIEDRNPVQWAMCQADIDAIDTTKLLEEIKADAGLKPNDRESLTERLTLDKARFEAHDAKVKELFAKDPTYKKMFEIAATARKESTSKKNTALRELTLAMDDARTTRSRRAVEGCTDKTWAAWQAAVGAIPAKRFTLAYQSSEREVMEAAAALIVGEPDGYLAAVALSACASGDGQPDILVKYVRYALLFWPGYRGPRNAAEMAILQAKLVLDDRDAKLQMPDIDRRSLFTGDGNGGNRDSNGGGRGPVVSLKPNGDKTRITLGPTKSKEVKCVDYRPGTRLSRITSSGTLVYEGTCNKYQDVMVTHDPPPPVDVSTRYTTGIKPGMTVTVIENAIMLSVANLSAKVPATILGAVVK